MDFKIVAVPKSNSIYKIDMKSCIVINKRLLAIKEVLTREKSTVANAVRRLAAVSIEDDLLNNQLEFLNVTLSNINSDLCLLKEFSEKDGVITSEDLVRFQSHHDGNRIDMMLDALDSVSGTVRSHVSTLAKDYSSKRNIINSNKVEMMTNGSDKLRQAIKQGLLLHKQLVVIRTILKDSIIDVADLEKLIIEKLNEMYAGNEEVLKNRLIEDEGKFFVMKAKLTEDLVFIEASILGLSQDIIILKDMYINAVSIMSNKEELKEVPKKSENESLNDITKRLSDIIIQCRENDGVANLERKSLLNENKKNVKNLNQGLRLLDAIINNTRVINHLLENPKEISSNDDGWGDTLV